MKEILKRGWNMEMGPLYIFITLDLGNNGLK